MDNLKVGAYIKEKLKEKGITQEKIAEQLGISSSAISQALSGKNLLDISNLNVLSQILDIPLDTIINGGEERETNLERLSKMTLEEIMQNDSELHCLQETDSKGKRFFDYLLKHENISAIEKLRNKNVSSYFKGDMRYLTLLIKTEKLELLKEFVNQDNRSFTLDIGKHAPESKYFEDKYESLSNEGKEFIETYTKCKNDKILKTYDLISKNNGDKKYIPAIIFYAVRFDQVHIVKMEEDLIGIDDKQYKQIFNRRFNDLLGYAIQFKSWKCIEHYYEKIDTFSIQSYFDILLGTKDIEFIEKFKNSLKPKNRDFYHNNQINNEFDNSKTLIDLVKTNDVELVKYAIQFSNQVALNMALENSKIDQIDIIKLLVKKGAIFTYRDSYSSNTIHELEPMTALMKYLLEKIEK